MINANYSQVSINNYMTCYVNDGIIYQIIDFNNNSQPIGVSNEKFEEALDKAEKYYNRLVELGDIQKPKTQEEINQELMQTVIQLQNEIKELKSNEHSNDSKDVGDRPKSSKSSSKSKQEL